MPNESKPIDWGSPELRRACVEYALQRYPLMGAGREARLCWTEVDAIGRSVGLGVDGAPGVRELVKWCRDKRLRPSGAFAGEIGLEGEGGERETALALAVEAAENAAGGTAGAVPAAIADPLTALLAEECDALSRAEREELARVLEGEGAVKLDRGQRLALAVMLRGSDFATRRDVVKALIDFLAPDSAVLTRVWEMRGSKVKLPPGGTVTVEPVGTVVPGFPVIGAQRLVIRDAEGGAVKVLLYARAEMEQEGTLWFKRLAPVQCFDEKGAGIRLALVSSWVRAEGRQLKEWGPLFGVTKAAVSWHGKQMQEKLGRGMRGQRQKPQANKGKKKGGRAA